MMMMMMMMIICTFFMIMGYSLISFFVRSFVVVVAQFFLYSSLNSFSFLLTSREKTLINIFQDMRIEKI